MPPAYRDILDAFDLLGHGSLLVDRDGQILGRSSRAKALWPSVVKLDDETGAGHATHLKTLVAGAVAAPRPTDCPPIALPRLLARALMVHAALVGGEGANLRAVLVLIDPDEIREPSAALLRSTFGLTRSEVDLAHHLCLGRALKDIARHRQTSVATLRVQLRALFVKTRTRRQAELVALLARLPPGLKTDRDSMVGIDASDDERR